jgi:ribosomal protein S18 acetylase RimI-like enzyme
LAIAVEEGYEGRGVGSVLLQALLARGGDRAIVLTARATNPALRLYERFGFETVATITSRVGTPSVKMLRPAAPSALR